MTDEPVRWGILGTGGIATKFVSDLPRVPGAQLAAVGSRSLDTAEAFAAKHGAAKAYGTWAELVADDTIDIVYVATPHHVHFDAALTCLNAGRAALVEKPLTLDRSSSSILIDTARAKGVFLMEAMWMRCNPVIRRMSALIADGAIGRVTAVHADFGLAGPFPPEHRLRNRAFGGGALLDLGIYPINLAHLALGMPTAVKSWAALSPEGVDENTGILFGYDDGAVAALTCSIIGATGNAAMITGTGGRIDLPTGFHRPQHLTLHRKGAEPEVIEHPYEGLGYQHEAIEVQRCLRAHALESPLVPHQATLDVMTLLDEIRTQIGVTYS